MFQAFYYAFTDWSLNTRTMREVNFVGLDNFRKMITEGYFLLGVKNLVIIMLCSFAKLLTIPVLLAGAGVRHAHADGQEQQAPLLVPPAAGHPDGRSGRRLHADVEEHLRPEHRRAEQHSGRHRQERMEAFVAGRSQHRPVGHHLHGLPLGQQLRLPGVLRG